MKTSFLLLLISGLPLFGFNISKELASVSHEVSQDQNLQQYLHKFPYTDYKIYKVPKLGRFYIDEIPDNIKSHLVKGIYWEREIGRLVGKFSLEGSVVIDLGSHIGIHTITMSKSVGKNGLVVSFEPQKKLFREQYYNLLLNHCEKNVVQLPLAVGESAQSISMTTRDIHNEGGTAIGAGGECVQMITLDSLRLEHVSCIKMDVERYELQVLKGARETIVRNKPVIIFEILGNHNLDTCEGEVREYYEATLKFLTDLEYDVTRINDSNDFVGIPPSTISPT